jgi:hypothetical protein
MLSYLATEKIYMLKLPIINPVYLMLGTSFGSYAKGNGLKALEFVLSPFMMVLICMTLQ